MPSSAARADFQQRERATDCMANTAYTSTQSQPHDDRAAVYPPAGAEPGVQRLVFRTDDCGHVLSPVSERARRRAEAVQLRAPSAPGHDLTRRHASHDTPVATPRHSPA